MIISTTPLSQALYLEYILALVLTTTLLQVDGIGFVEFTLAFASLTQPLSIMNVEQVRSRFPALSTSYIYADNAGGSQCTAGVIHAITDYLSNTNVQLGADYSIGVKSTTRVSMGPTATAMLTHASSPSEIIFSNSSTQLAENLARAMEPSIKRDGQEEFIATLEHEANVGPWQRLAKRTNNHIHFWKPTAIECSRGNASRSNPFAIGYTLESLEPLLSAKTRLVALSACSNILGSFFDIKSIVQRIRDVVHQKSDGKQKVEIVVDCVAYAPHRRINTVDWDVDYAFFSYYKVYGPHTAAMWVRASTSNASLNSINHYFVTDPANRLQLGGPGYELTYATSAVLDYLFSIANPNHTSLLLTSLPSETQSRELSNGLDESFKLMEAHERTLVERLLSFLTAEAQWNRGIRVVGSDDNVDRAPTISFVVLDGSNGEPRMRSKDVVSGVDKLGNIGIRFGHFYAARLIDFLGLAADDGIVRVSLVHYNTLEEVDKIIAALKQSIGIP